MYAIITHTGEAATKQHIFAMKLSVSVFSFLAFVIMCANADIQEPDLTPAIMTTPQCYLWQNGYGAEGAFNMRTYQLVIALAFFNWLKYVMGMNYQGFHVIVDIFHIPYLVAH